MAGSRHTLKLRRSRLIGVERKEKRIMKILLIEDDIEISEMLCSYLIAENFEVVCATDGQKACEAFDIGSYSIVLLDLMIPQITGMNVMKYIRQKSTVPIIIISAKDSDSDKTLGLGLGADDYITKPFLPLELVARVKAQLRRYKKYNVGSAVMAADEVFKYAGLTMNIKTYECRLNGETLSLTPTEFSILRILLERRCSVVSAEELFHEVWQEEYYTKSNNTITVHIRHLREKMKDTGENPRYIKTVWGVGYKIGEI